MSRPHVIAYHLIWTAYGAWLPNDPRGSGSRAVASDVLKELGQVHYGRKRIQPPRREVREFYDRAKPLLKHPVVMLSPEAVNSVACGLAEAVEQYNYTCYAAAVLPDHVHLLIRKHRDKAAEMLARLKALSRKRLVDEGWRNPAHPVWSGGDGWKVFLDSPGDVRRTIAYVEENPVKAGQAAQQWPFVSPYDGWPQR